MTTTVLGYKISMPIMIAPTAMQKMAHPEGMCSCFFKLVLFSNELMQILYLELAWMCTSIYLQLLLCMYLYIIKQTHAHVRSHSLVQINI